MAALDLEKEFLEAASNGDLLHLLSAVLGLTQEAENGEGTTAYETIMDDAGKNALHLAAAAGKTHICMFLVEKLKFYVDWRDNKGDTPLLVAILEQRHPTAVYLIENGAGVGCRNYKGYTALHYAAEKGQAEIVQLLLSKGAQVMPEHDSAEGMPLHLAALYGNKECVKILLDNGADPNITSVFNFTPLTLAVSAYSYECLDLLLKAGADPNITTFEKTTLTVAACGGDARIIERLLKDGANPNVVDAFGMTPLENAAIRGNFKAVTTLFPSAPRVSYFPDWSVGGILKHVMSEEGITQIENRMKNDFKMSKDKGREAFEKKDYEKAIFWYCQANLADKSDEVVLSNRSLCWLMLNQASHALDDAKECIALKPDWPKAHYREGAAHMLLHDYSMASKAFSQALELNPNNEEIKQALWKAMEAEIEYRSLFDYFEL